MIEGLKIKISSDELRKHLQARANHHLEKVTFYNGQVSALHDSGLQTSMTSNDPVGSLKHSAKDHQDKFALFTFLADHIIPDEEYLLSENDLSRIELAARYF